MAPLPDLLIDADRLWQRLMALGRIGSFGAGGVDRPALSAGEREAWGHLIVWGAAAGLEPATDPAANLFVTLPGRDRSLPPLLAGSHIDSQPTGGRFDGAFGTLAALEAVTALAAAGLMPAQDITVVAWMNEEGSRYAPGMMGSEAFSGRRSLAEIRATLDAEGIAAGDEIDRHHAAFPDLPLRPLGFAAAAYLEAHIEQASLLQAAGLPLGIVTGIQGKKTWEITVTGREAHAGTEPMATRADALQAFARIAVALQAAMAAGGEATRFTIGRLDVAPNAPSVVPARARFRIDLRHPDNGVLDSLAATLEAVIAAEAAPCDVQILRMVDAPGNAFDPGLRARLHAAAAARGRGAMDLLSAAGHDARHLAAVTPSAMIFIPCRDGISHHPDEWAEPGDVAAGAQLLLDILADLAGPLLLKGLPQ